MKKRITALLLCLVMALSLIPTSAWAANADAEGTDDGISVQASNSTVVLHPSTGTTPTGFKVSVGDKINGYNVTKTNSVNYEITIELDKYNVSLQDFRIPLPEEVWEGVKMQYGSDATYVIAGTAGAAHKTPGSNALLANGGNTFYYYNLGNASSGETGDTYLWNFTLKYDANGGTGAPADQTWGTNDKYTKSHTFNIPSTVPTRDGYVFKGWSDTKGGSATRQPGGTCLVSQTVSGYNGGSVTKTLYAVWEEEAPPAPAKPTDNEVKTLLGAIVDVYCTVEQENGADKRYGPYDLEDGTFTVSDVAGDATNGYTCTVTIKDGAEGVDKYTSKPTGHSTDGSKNADMVKTITLTRSASANKWSVSNNGRFKLYAKCEQTPPVDPPTKPTGDEVKTLLDTIVDVYCTVEQVNNADKLYGPYSLEDGTFTVGDVAGDATNGYTCTVTIKDGAEGVDKYTSKPTGHTTDDSKDADMVKTVTLTRSASANEWSVSNNGRFKLYAKCDPTPNGPKNDELKTLLTGKIKVVDTTKRHSDTEYNVLENSVTVGAVQGNAADGYTCTVTITYAPYVSTYNREQSFTHTLEAGSVDKVQLTLNYDKTAKTWNLDNGVTSPYATINVECGVPADPTVADLNGVNVKVSCAKHNAHTYALAGNETLRVVEKKQDANGQWYCLVTLSENSAKTFLVKYDAEKDIDKTHSKVDTYGTVKLVWVDGVQLLSTAAAANGRWVLAPQQGQVLTLTTSCTTSTVPGGNNIGPAKNPYTKDEPKKVESGKTFDAGIALYVGLGILSLTGSAVAIRKREEY